MYMRKKPSVLGSTFYADYKKEEAQIQHSNVACRYQSTDKG
jgi:hypothetical protein